MWRPTPSRLDRRHERSLEDASQIAHHGRQHGHRYSQASSRGGFFRARLTDDAGLAECPAQPVVPGLRFHDLRRSGIRNMTRSGVPPSIAMSISGHRTISTFLRYDIASEEDKREALRKVEASVAAEASKTSNVVSIRKHGENTGNRGSEAGEGSTKSLK